MLLKQRIKKLIGLTVIAAICCSCFVQADASVKKDETVYVTLTAEGQPKERIVSDWLHSDEAGKELHDKSVLKDIANIKGEEMPEINGEDVTWKPSGNDIYYQGTTDKQLPIEVKITYYLDGQKISSSDLAGKSGKLKISIQLKNLEKHEVSINGKDRIVYTPLTALAVMDFPCDVFSNLSVSEGKVISEGNNQVVTFAGLPGLKESLGLDSYSIDGIEELSLPEKFEITADVREFEMGPIMITVTPELPDLSALKMPDEVTELRNGLSDMKAAGNELAEGTDRLANGIDTANSRLVEFQSGMQDMGNKDDLLSLFTDEKRLNAEHLLLDDAFAFYDMDKTLINLAPKLVTKENIGVLDKIMADINRLEAGKLLTDNTFLNALPEKFAEVNSAKAAKLMADADALKTLDTTRILPFTSFINSSDKLAKLADGGIKLIGSADKSKLQLLEAMTANDSSLMILLDNIEQLKKSLDYNEKFLQQTSIFTLYPGLKDKLEAGKLNEATEEEKLVLENIVSQVFKDQSAAMNLAIENNKLDEKTVQLLENAIIGVGFGSNEFYRKAADTLLASDDPKLQDIKKQAAAIITAAGDYRTSVVSAAAEMSKVKEVLSSIDVKTLSDGLNYASALISGINQFETELNANKDEVDSAIALLNDSENMDYLKKWVPKLLEMKKDLDENEQNIIILKSIMAMQQDPETKQKLEVLQQDFDMLKPLLIQLNSMLQDTATNKSIHDSPDMVQNLMKMKQDLEDNRKILEILRSAVEDKNVELVNKLLQALPELENGVEEMQRGSETLAENMKKFNEEGIQELSGKLDMKINSLDEVLAVKDELQKLSEDYGVYSSKDGSMKGSVRFVMKTDEIRKPELKTEEKETVKESKGFFSHIKDIFSDILGLLGL